MKHCTRLLILSLTLCIAPSLGQAQSYAPTAKRGAELVEKLDLRPEQLQRSHALLAQARKQAIRTRADIEIAAIDLAMELAKPSPNEKVAGVLIEKMSALEGQRRRSRIVTWVKIRKLLSEEQRQSLKRLRSDGGSDIVETQGAFINPFRSIDAPPRYRSTMDDIVNPFEESRPKPAPRRKKAALSRLRVSTASPARILVDGKARGISPVQLRLRQGSHRVRAVFLDGSTPVTKVIRVNGNKRTRIHILANTKPPGLSPAEMLE